MSEFKGTKGKWEYFNGGTFREVQIKKPLKSICAVNPNIEEHEANAKLISCAPEMLEMLKDILSGMNNENFEITGDEIENLIKKATEL